MKIIHKMILAFLAVIVLVAFVIGFFAIDSGQKALQRSIEGSSETLAVEVMDKIDRTIYSRIEEFQAYSTDLLLREQIMNSNREFEGLDDMHAYINRMDEEWRSAGKEVITPFMQGLMRNPVSEELREKIDFYERKYGYKVFGEVFATNRYGANVVQTGKTTDYRHDDEPWWRRAKAEGLHVEDVAYDESSGIYSIDIGIRIDDSKGGFIGIMKVVLNIEEVTRIIKELRLPEPFSGHRTLHLKLLTRDGRLIYSTKEFRFLEDASHMVPDFVNRSRKHVATYIRQGHEPDEGEELSVHVHSKGYKDYKGLGWILMIDHETEEIFAPIARLKMRIIGASAAIAALAVLIGVLIARSISGSLRRLEEASIEIGRGNLDARIEANSKDEVGMLARTFNRMAEELKKTTVSRDLLAREVEERRRMEEALSESEEKFRTISSAARDAILMMDNDGNVSFWNEAAEEIFGYSKNEAIGRPLHSTIVPERFREAYEKGFASFRETGRGPVIGRTVEVEAVRKDGTEFPVELSISAVRFRGKWHAIGILRDITERKRMEEALSESEEKFRTISSAARDAILMIDNDGKISFWNEAAERMFGFPNDEVTGRPLHTIIVPERYRGAHQKGFASFRETGKGPFIGRTVEVEAVRKDETEFPVELSISAVRFRGKWHAIGILRDITERRKVEAERERLLRETERANKELNDFAYIVSHDLKAPLRAITQLAQWITEDYADRLDEEGREQLDLLSKRARHMHNLIDGILQYSRAGRIQGTPEKVATRMVVEEAIDAISPPENIRFEVHDDLPEVWMDPIQMRQVFQNLLSNAVKFMDKPEGLIEVGCNDKGTHWEFYVRDNGPGMEEHHFERIFQIFQTLHSRDEFDSSGIGLSIVKKIVERNGGEVRVESRVDKGTTFYFTLPKHYSVPAHDGGLAT